MLKCEKCPEQDSAEKNKARQNDCRARPAVHEQQKERKREVKLVFNRQRPCVGERSAAVERDVLNRNHEFPPRVHVRVFPPRRQKNVGRQDDEIGGHDPQRASRKKTTKMNSLSASERG